MDPVRRTQENLYAQLLSIRDSMCKTLACSVENAGNQQVSSPATASDEASKNPEIDELKAENKKMEYRVTHLMRAIEDLEKAKKWMMKQHIQEYVVIQ